MFLLFGILTLCVNLASAQEVPLLSEVQKIHVASMGQSDTITSEKIASQLRRSLCWAFMRLAKYIAWVGLYS